MTDQLDLSLLAGISDPELRSSLERLGNALQDASARSEPETPSSAKIIQFPLFPESTRPVANDMARSALFSCVQGTRVLPSHAAFGCCNSLICACS
jgi:hypothetical protein